MSTVAQINKEVMDNFSKHRKEAKHTLIYTLHLREVFADIKNNPKNYDAINNPCGTIETLATGIWEDCDVFTNSSNFNFGGYKGDPKDLSNLASRTSFWEHAFKQDAILFTFDKLRKLIGECCVLIPYKRIQLSNYGIKEGWQFDTFRNGLDFLTSDSNATSPCHITTQSSCPTIEYHEAYLSSGGMFQSKYVENSKNHKHRIERLESKLNKAQIKTDSLYLHQSAQFCPHSDNNSNSNSAQIQHNNLDTVSDDPHITVAQLEFHDFFVSRKSGGTLSIQNSPLFHPYQKSTFSKKNYREYMITANKLWKNINADFLHYDHKGQKDPSELHMLSSDKIYLISQIEKIFGLSTINCIYQNIHPTAGQAYDLTSQGEINMISSCLRLPNIFTRNYILQMAIDTLSKHYDENFGDSDFFSNIQKNSRVAVSYSYPSDSYLREHAKLILWENRYQNLMNYLAQVLFPVYENYFFCAFWDAVKYNMKDHSDNDGEIAITMYKKIRDYLNNDKCCNDYKCNKCGNKNMHNNRNCREALFNTEDIMRKEPYEWKEFTRENIIKPNFAEFDETVDNEKVEETVKHTDTALYKRCLAAHANLTSKTEPVDDFISPAYFDRLSSYTKKDIQATYILDSISYAK